MRQPKFIITNNGFFRLGMVYNHRDLLLYGEDCYGGGYYYADDEKRVLHLDRTSYDYGVPRWHLLQRINLPRCYEGWRIVYSYDDTLREPFVVTDLLEVEYYD